LRFLKTIRYNALTSKGAVREEVRQWLARDNTRISCMQSNQISHKRVVNISSRNFKNSQVKSRRTPKQRVQEQAIPAPCFSSLSSPLSPISASPSSSFFAADQHTDSLSKQMQRKVTFFLFSFFAFLNFNRCWLGLVNLSSDNQIRLAGSMNA
jgi:hypothetical protein